MTNDTRNVFVACPGIHGLLLKIVNRYFVSVWPQCYSGSLGIAALPPGIKDIPRRCCHV